MYIYIHISYIYTHIIYIYTHIIYIYCILILGYGSNNRESSYHDRVTLSINASHTGSPWTNVNTRGVEHQVSQRGLFAMENCESFVMELVQWEFQDPKMEVR